MLIQPVLRPVLQPVLRSTFDPGIGGGGTPIRTPASLFAKYSGVGGYWDFTDMATLSQDSAGTTPVTAASQPVGRVLDKSGQGNHVIQSTSAKRPTYNGACITPDGVDDFFVTAGNLDLSACDKVVVAMGYTKIDDSPTRIQSEFSSGWVSNPGSFVLISGQDGASRFQYCASRGDAGAAFEQSAMFTTARPNEYGAHISRNSIPGDLGEVWWNGTKGADSTTNKGSGTFGSYLLYLLARNSASNLSNTPTRRAFVMGVPVANSQVSDDDIELIRLWLMEGA